MLVVATCRGNPGPCGAGARLFVPNEERVDLKQPVSRRSSILLGELVAIKIALESIKAEMERLIVQKIMLFSDSQSAVGILTLGWVNTSHRSIILEIKQTRLFYGTGSSEFSCKLFLGVKVKDELQEYREIMNEVFDQYISNTNRFKTK